MSEQAIEKLKERVVRVAAIAFMLVMIFMGGLMYSTNLFVMSGEINEVLRYLVAHDGDLPSDQVEEFSDILQNEEEARQNDGSIETDSDLPDMVRDAERALRSMFSSTGSYDTPEFVYSTRYFAVIYPENEEEHPIVKSTHMASVDHEQALAYADKARAKRAQFGRIDNYYYRVGDREDGGQIAVIMDCTSQISTARHLLNIALLLIACGMLLSWLVLRWLAPRMVAPEVQSAELQKQFITNASHELKTPLAVIRANTELTEAMSGETEWTQSTLRQVDRLQGLIQNLVLITRAQEQDSKDDRVDTDLVKALTEQIDTFRPVATQDGKTLTVDLPEELHMVCESGQIRELAALLIDNAIKYCDDGGEVAVKAWRKGKWVHLTVSNHYKDGAGKDYERFFDRFYREDQSHAQDKGGYGIGLSIAESIVRLYMGSIDASWKEGIITFTCKLLG